MRENLVKYSQGVYRARFGGYGHKLTLYGPELTVLLLDVTFVKKGVVVADHVWADFHEGFVNENCRPGDIVEVDGRAKKYKKGFHHGYRISNDSDYKLVIQNVRKIEGGDL